MKTLAPVAAHAPQTTPAPPPVPLRGTSVVCQVHLLARKSSDLELVLASLESTSTKYSWCVASRPDPRTHTSRQEPPQCSVFFLSARPPICLGIAWVSRFFFCVSVKDDSGLCLVASLSLYSFFPFFRPPPKKQNEWRFGNESHRGTGAYDLGATAPR